MELEQIGVRLALLGRGEYLAGLAEASRGVDQFSARTDASGRAVQGATRQTVAHRDAVGQLRRATEEAIGSQRAYERALQEVALADKEAASMDADLAAKRRANAAASAEATRAQRDASVAQVRSAADGVKAEEDLAERTRLAGVRKMSTWDAFRTAVLGQSATIRTATLGVAETEALAAKRIEEANARKVAAWRTGAMGISQGAAIVAGGIALVGVVSVASAAKFDASMERIHTLAGVPQPAIKGLSDQVLNLAGKVAQDPNSLAEAMYHVESAFQSAGINAAQAGHLLEVAAKGATMGQADLVSVTNALDAAVVSGIPGVQNFDQAMGALNATVGAGDMQMQDLADAFGHGNLAMWKTAGLSIRDVGAALADFGDNNLRGAAAGTQLRMAVASLQVPATNGKKALHELGLQQDTLAKDLQRGGLNAAITDLHGRLVKSGHAGKDMGLILTTAFGKRAGQGITTLMNDFDRFQGKFGEVDKGANTFAEHWAATTQQVQFKLHAAGDAAKATGIRIGEALAPVAGFVLDKFASMARGVGNALDWLGDHKGVLIGIGAALFTLLIPAMGALAIAAWGVTAAFLANPLTWIAVAVGVVAFAVYELVTHWREAWGWVTGIVSGAWRGITGAISTGWHKVTGFFSSMWDGIKGFFSKWGMTILMVLAPFIGIPIWIITHWRQVLDFFKALPGRIADFLGFLTAKMFLFFVELPGRIRVFVKNAGTWLHDTGRDIINGLVRGIITFAAHVYVFFVTLPDRIRAFGKNAGHWLHDTGRDIINGLIRGIITFAAHVYEFFHGMPGKIGDFFKGAGHWLSNVGNDITRGLVHGLEDGAHAVIDWAKGLIDKFLGGFKRGLGIASPSKVFAGFGGDIIRGFLNGLRALVGMVVDFFVGFAKRLASGFRNELRWVVAAATWLWGQIKAVFDKIGQVFWWIVNAVVKVVVAAWQREINGLGNIWRWFHDSVWKPVADKVAAVFRWIHDTIIKPVSDFIMQRIRNIATNWQWFHDSVWKPVADKVGAVFTWIHDNVIKPVSDKINTVIHSVGQTFSDVVDWIKRTWQTVQDIVSTPVRFVVNVVYGKAIKPTWDAIAGVFGLPPAPAGPAFREGGIVDDPQALPGRRAALGLTLPGHEPGVDRFTIGVGGGESVMVPEWTRAMLRWFGPSAIGMMNHEARHGRHPLGSGSGSSGTHGRGLPGGYDAFAGPAGNRARAANYRAAHAGPSAGGSTGTMGRGYADGGMVGTMGAGRDLPAVRLPQEPAVTGLADSVLHSLGSIFDIPELFTDPKGWLGGIFKPITDPLNAMGNAEVMKAMQAVPGKAIDGMVSKIEESITSMFAGPISGGGAPAGVVRGWIETALRILHWPLNYEGGIYEQIMTESGGNPGAVQHGYTDVNTLSGNLARGIMQVIPPTFRANALPGHGNIMNPVDNIIAGSRYAMGKYGASWFNPGPRHKHGYEGGGIVGVSGGVPFGGHRAEGGPISPGQSYVVGERGPEMIVPSSPGRVLDDQDTRENLGGGRRGDVHFHEGAIVVKAAADPRQTAQMVADEVADRIARS